MSDLNFADKVYVAYLASKAFIVSCGSIAIAYMWPIKNHITVIFIVAAIDVVVGIAESWIVQDENFKPKKVFKAMGYLCIYFAAVALVWLVGEMQGDPEEAKFIVKSISYGVVWLYGKNVFRNAESILPDNEALHYLSYIFNLEFLKRMPHLADYKGRSKTKKQKTEPDGNPEL